VPALRRAPAILRGALCSAALSFTLDARAAMIPVTSAADSGPFTLRQAILDANATGASDTITFAIGTGPQTITLVTALPPITHPVIIDGTTQPGYAGSPLIELNGNGLTGDGLTISGGSSTVKGLVVNRFNGRGIYLLTLGGNMVANCYVGTNQSGTIALGNTIGIDIRLSSSSNQIGGTSASLRNVISGNQNGVDINATCTGNHVEGNYIGTNPAGSAALGNTSIGVFVSGASNFVGGSAPGAGNVISGNGSVGVLVESGTTGVLVEGNLIGTNALGSVKIPNGGHGVSVGAAAATIRGNVVSGNGGRGIHVSGAEVTSGSIVGNFVGLVAAGNAALANTAGGIDVVDATNVVIGGTVVADLNVVSGNGANGIAISGTGGSHVVEGNYVGTDSLGAAAIPNAGAGISVAAAGVTVGGTAAGAGNVISGNAQQGIVVTGTSGTKLQGNLVGTDLTGGVAIPNAVGVDVGSSTGVTIGGTTAAARNVISGNSSNGVRIGSGSSTCVVSGNFIGTRATGSVVLGNGDVGVLVSGASTNTIGGEFGSLSRNVISGNVGNVEIRAGATGNTVEGNYIGTNAAGTAALSNHGPGVWVYNTSGNTVGGTSAANRNVISGNPDGVLLQGPASGTVVQGNYIGTDAAGTAALPNLQGIRVFGAAGNTIGGGSGAANVISGNIVGVLLEEAGTTGNMIRGNLIGTRPDGSTPLGNTQAGVAVKRASGNSVGGLANANANVIAGNDGYGVVSYGGWANQILRNSIYGNALPGIALDPATGVTPNDVLDKDYGPNKKQNYPILFLTSTGASTTTVDGWLKSLPNASYRVELFGAAACDASGFGEGQTYLGSTNVTTDAAGFAGILADLPTTSPGAFVTATATDAAGNTSEFSTCLAAGSAGTMGEFRFAENSFSVSEADGTAVISVLRTHGFTAGSASVHYQTANGTATQPADYAATSGTLTFAAGEVVKTFSMPVVLDGVTEPNETVALSLDSPSPGSMTLGTPSSATLTIKNHEASFPAISLGDGLAFEGSSGTRNVSFTVRSTPHTAPVTVGWTTVDGTATAGSDYQAKSGSTLLAPGETARTETAAVMGDAAAEGDENFFVIMTSITGPGYAFRTQAEIVIMDDDGLPNGIRGDADGDSVIDVLDVFYLINGLFAGGPQPTVCRGDANADGVVDVLDVFYLINYLFAAGAFPLPSAC
jgi:hypothetical protein